MLEIRLDVPLGGFTEIISGGVSSIGPPGGGLMDAQLYMIRIARANK